MEKNKESEQWDIILKAIQELYQEIDKQTDYLNELHHDRLHCRKGCFSCCVEDITVFEVEAENIRHHYQKLLETEKPYPAGGCAFLSSTGACRIYEHRPYVCRTQGLPLRWIEPGDSEEEMIEMRDICPLNDDEEQPIEKLPALQCWSIGPIEEALARLQSCLGDGSPKRIALRDLFRSKNEAV